MLNLIDFGQNYTKKNQFETKKNFGQEIKILTHSENFNEL